MKSKYIHTEKTHNLESPKEIVPLIIKELKPKSVIDFGCGTGTFLKVFKENGINVLMGLDGHWVNRDLLHQNIDETEFEEVNLEQEVNLQQKYDLVLSLEVAEHLSEDAAKVFIKNLISAGDKVIFSAAIPHQGGQNHINEQWITYWEKLFNAHNFILHDIFRHQIWDNPKVFPWYKQNMVLFCKKDVLISSPKKQITNIVHYDLFKEKADLAYKVQNPSFFFSLKLLIRSIIKTFK